MKSSYPTAEMLALAPLFLAGASFAIGTVLLLLCLVANEGSAYYELCFYYVGYSFCVNAFAFVGLMGSSFFYRSHQNQIIGNTMLLLINIPVVLFYSCLLILIN